MLLAETVGGSGPFWKQQTWSETPSYPFIGSEPERVGTVGLQLLDKAVEAPRDGAQLTHVFIWPCPDHAPP